MMTATINTKRFSAALLAMGAFVHGVSAQVDLYSNRGPSPSVPALGASAVSLSGVAAPADSFWSETPAIGTTESNAIAGFSTHLTGLTGSYRFADDFTIADQAGWTISTIAFFAYQTGASPLTSPFSAINVRIWNGRPGDANSTIVFGDTTTNRLTASTATSTYRIFNTVVAPQPFVPDTTRLIWRTEAGIGNLHLAPGTYWVDWQYTTTNPSEEAFSPAATVAGARTQTGANGRQFKITGGSTPGLWSNAVDLGKPSTAADLAQDFPFVIRGALGNGCLADFNGDGAANSQDFFDYLTAFFLSAPSADFNHDTMINSQDFFDFLTAFFAGC